MNIINNKFYNLSYFLVLSLPFFLITGPFLADLSIVLLSLSLVFFFKNHYSALDINLQKFIKFFILFYFLINFSSLLSTKDLQFNSFKVSLPYIRYLLFIVAVYLIFLEKNKLINTLSKIIILIIIIFFIDSLIQKIFGFNLLNYKISTTGRVSSFFKDELIMGSFICKVYLLGFAYLYDLKKPFYSLIYLFITLIIIIFSQERSSLFLFFLSSSLLLICIKEYRKYIKFFIIIIPIVLLLIYVFNKENFHRVYKVTYFQLILNKGSIPIFSNEHQNHFKTAINLFVSKPFFGHGIKSFRVLCSIDPYTVEKDVINNSYLISNFDDQLIITKDHIWENWSNVKFKNNNFNFSYSDADQIYFKNGDYVKKGDLLVKYKIYEKDGCSTHPHNYIFQLLAETGFFSFLFFILLFAINIFALLKVIKSNNFINSKNNIIFLHIMLIINFFPLLPTGSFYNNWLCILNFYPIGLLFAQYRLK